MFATVDTDHRVRSASDLIRLAISGAVLVGIGAAAIPTAGIEQSVISFATSLPPMLDGLWHLVADVAAALAVVVILAAIVNRRFALLLDITIAVAACVALTSLAARIVVGAWPGIGSFFRLPGALTEFPTARLAVAATVLIAAAPHLVGPLRRVARGSVLFAGWSLVAVGHCTAASAIAAILVGVVSASIERLVLGSTHAQPTLDDVASDLEALGVAFSQLARAEQQSAGRFTATAVHPDGRRLIVKVYGREAADTQFLRSAWRALWFRGPTRTASVGRVQQVEREALLTLFAHEAGIATHEVIAAGVTAAGDAVLVLSDPGTTLHDDPSAWTTDMARLLWGAVSALHGRGISHGQVDGLHAIDTAERDIDGAGRVGLVDFHDATLSPSAAVRHTDDAQTLVTTALALGCDAAVAVALDELETDRLAAMLPTLQTAALTRHQRAEVGAHDLDVDQLRDQVAIALDMAPPALRKLRRITARTIIQLVLMFVAFSAISAAFGEFDLGLLVDAVRDGIWWLMAAGFLLAQVGRVGSAVSTVGAAPEPIPLQPVYVLQLALSYIGIALPGSAARFAVNVRFMQRQGLPPGSAVAVSALDSVAWFAVQVCVVVGILMATPLSLDLDLGSGTSDGLNSIVAVIGIVALVAVVALIAIPRLRNALVATVRELLVEARDATRGLWSARRLGMLIGGNLATELFMAMALGAFARSLGYSVGLIELLLINVSVCLLAGLLPIPGGIGVVEAGLTFGLVRAGVPEEAAFATALLFRFATFYLPPAWGFFAFRWLERRQLL